MKIYRVLVTWTDGADVSIKAASIEEARRQAVALVEEGKASYEMDASQASSFTASDALEVEYPDDVDKKNAGENAEAWAEYEAERAE